MTLEETHSKILETAGTDGLVARVHTGDPSLYGAIKEQMLLLDRDHIDYEIIPGVTVAFAAAAAAKVSFTLPEKAQTLILTRLAGRTPVPHKEQLRDLARHNTSLAVYLSAGNPEGVVEALLEGGYPEDTPVVVAHRVGWPDERIIATHISALTETVHGSDINKQAIFLILPGQDDDPVFSRLYSSEFAHGFRSGCG
jgi:precorrin-4/cobalt-precorrin-4 C11-methyltransferase